MPHEILTRSNATRELEGIPPATLYHLIHRPSTAVNTLFLNFKPLQAARRSCRRIINTGKVRDDRSLVTLCYRVLRITGRLGATDNMPPEGAYLGASLDIDNFRRHWLDKAGVAGKVCVFDIQDRVVGLWGTDSLELALICAVDLHALEDCVGGHRDREGEEVSE